jgi:hypothetical protein
MLLIEAGEISVHSRVAEGSIFAFFIPVRLSTLPTQHQTVAGAFEIHHSLRGQISAPSGTVLGSPAQVAGPIARTVSRPRRASTNQAETIHVLLVEDNEISQRLLKKQLVRAGCSVVTANDGVEAVETLLRNSGDNDTDDRGNKDARIQLILMGEWFRRCNG